MVIIGMNCISPNSKKSHTIHINSDYIKSLDEDDMIVTLDNDRQYRIDEESLDIFLSAVYAREANE